MIDTNIYILLPNSFGSSGDECRLAGQAPPPPHLLILLSATVA